MSALRDFLNWYEGFSENIEKAPTEKQWKRITERLAKLRDNPEPNHIAQPMLTASAMPAVDPEVDPVPGGATVTQKWKDGVREHLAETQGFDNEDISKAFRDPRFVVDLNLEPSVMAERIANWPLA